MLDRESGENEDPNLKYCSSFPVFGPLVVMSTISFLGLHSSRSLIPGRGRGHIWPRHLEILQTMSWVADPLYGIDNQFPETSSKLYLAASSL